MKLVFEWDKKKAELNERKHGVRFDEAKTIFADENLFTFADDTHSDNEQRFISIGIAQTSRVVLVVHTETDKTGDEILIRIISSRKATKAEQRFYEQR